MKINIIVAFSKNRGIGIDNNLPWNLPSDLKKFRKLTIGNGNNAVIMGKNTWDSLPVKYLKQRDNLILSKTYKIDTLYQTNINNNQITNTIKSFDNINKILDFCDKKKYDTIWIIGGSQIYNLFMNYKIEIYEIYVTYIDKEFECDTFFPSIDIDKYSNVKQSEHITENLDIDYKVYDRVYLKK